MQTNLSISRRVLERLKGRQSDVTGVRLHTKKNQSTVKENERGRGGLQLNQADGEYKS